MLKSFLSVGGYRIILTNLVRPTEQNYSFLKYWHLPQRCHCLTVTLVCLIERTVGLPYYCVVCLQTKMELKIIKIIISVLLFML